MRAYSFRMYWLWKCLPMTQTAPAARSPEYLLLENAQTCIDSEGGQIDFLVNRVKAVRFKMVKHGASQSSTNSTRTTSH